MDLYFGWRSAVLLCAIVVVLPIAAALCQTARNRTANRTLASLLFVLVGVITPWMIGFAGFYDRWRWLTFLPVANPLFVPAFAWFYAHALMYGRWPPRARLALLPGLFHFALMMAGFLLPLPLKLAVADATGSVISGGVAICLVIGFVVGIIRIRRSLRAYARWIEEQRSDDERYATRWLHRSVVVMGGLFAIWAAFELTDLVYPLGYSGLMPLYLAIAAVMVVVAVEGWRHGELDWPVMADGKDTPATPPTASGQDWRDLGERWRDTIRDLGHYREHELSLARAARLLGTNTTYLSRACNEGLEMSFSAMINRLRAEAVAAAIAAQPDAGLLDLALEAGFASKASFNRAFAERYGMSPSAWRRSLRS